VVRDALLLKLTYWSCTSDKRLLRLLNRFSGVPNSPPHIVEKKDRIPILKNISEPISRKAWQLKLEEKDSSMASQDSW
jgi:hypothetical protein